jgi:hypothetical protein
MKRAIVALVIGGAMVISSGSALAMQKGQGGGPKPKASGGGSTHASKAHSPTPKGQGQSAAKAPKAPKAPKSVTATGPKTSGQGNSGAKATKPAKAPKTATADTNTVATTGTLSPVQQKLQKNTNLANKLDGRLPAGMDPVAAAAGFRNLGQFVAAVNVSNNLGIPFTQLKTSMVTDGKSLGQAIQTHRPSADFNTEARRAESDATTFVNQYDDATVTPKKKPKKSDGGN